MICRALLWLFHLFLNLYRFISCLRPRRAPRPLLASRRKLPKHLAVVFGDYYGVGVDRSRITSRTAEFEDTMESVRRLVGWCRVIGVGILSVYDQQGILKAHWKEIQDMLNEGPDSFTALGEKLALSPSGASSPQPGRRLATLNSKPYWLPTPPPSASNSSLSLTSSPDSPDSPPSTQAELLNGGQGQSEEPLLVTLKVLPATLSLSDDQSEVVRAGTKLRNRHSSSFVAPTLPKSPGPLTIHILTPLLGKPHIAAIASELAHKALQAQVAIEEFKLTVQELGAKFEDPSHPNGWACPDLLIINTPATANLPQKAPFMLQGIPPWQIHLTEMTHIPPRRPQSSFLRKFWPAPNPYPGAITETAFRTALDEYDGAEMRLGK